MHYMNHDSILALVLPIRCGKGIRGDGASSDGALVGVGVAQLRDDDPPAGHRGQVQLLQDVRQRHRVAVHRLLPVRPGAAGAPMCHQESATTLSCLAGQYAIKFIIWVSYRREAYYEDR